MGSTIGTTGTNAGNTFPATYDTVGRYFTVGATVTSKTNAECSKAGFGPPFFVWRTVMTFW